MNSYFDYKGCIHIHSRESDGSGTIPDIIKTAQQTPLDYIIITDHNILNKKWEGVYGNLVVLVGEEIGKGDNHFLALKIQKTVNPTKNPVKYLEAVKDQDGLGFVAHPHGVGKPLFLLKSRRWTHWGKNGFNGLELWTYMYDWIEKVNPLNIPYYLAKPEKAITGPRKETLEMWDKLNQYTKHTAIGGLDAHASILSRHLKLNYPSYEKLFKTIRTHVITPEQFNGDFDHDSSLVYKALEQGNCYISYDYYREAKNMEFYYEKDNHRVIMGQETTFRPSSRLFVKCGEGAQLKLVKNGELLGETLHDSMELTVPGPGVYRVEAYLDNQPWIYTNAILIRES